MHLFKHATNEITMIRTLHVIFQCNKSTVPVASPARTALSAAHFERNDGTIICETTHWCVGRSSLPQGIPKPNARISERLDHWEVDGGNWDNKRPASSVLE